MRFLLAFVFALSQFPLLANAAGVYLSTELGAGIGTSIKTDSRDTDFPTLCDKVLDPNDLFTPTGGCPQTAEGDQWKNGFGRAAGFMAGAALGYGTDLGLRVEAEYFRVSNNYSETSDIETGSQDVTDKSQRELVRADERIGRVTIDSVFANVYYDLPVSGALRPYLGGGVGMGIAKIGYDSVWARNNDPTRIATAAPGNATYNGTGNEDADRTTFHERVAGTTTTASKTLRDTVFGYQAVIGADYMLTDKTSIGLKGRWVKYATFEDGGNQWDQLRSHASANNRGGDGDTVVYTVKTDDLSSFGVSVVMKYAF